APLQAMPQLAAVARAHSEDMARNRFIAHVSRTTGTTAERLTRAGLSSGLVLENLGRGYSSREVHEGLMASPGHRATLLNDRITHVGIGVARERGPGGALIVTENFIQVAPPIDLASAPPRLLHLVNSARVRRSANPLEIRQQLADVAGTTAR